MFPMSEQSPILYNIENLDVNNTPYYHLRVILSEFERWAPTYNLSEEQGRQHFHEKGYNV